MKYHGAATHDDASKFRARMKERERIAEKRRALEQKQPPATIMLMPKARAK